MIEPFTEIAENFSESFTVRVNTYGFNCHPA